MDKEKLLQMTVKEIEMFLNDSISSIKFESPEESEVKGRMISSVRELFDDTVVTSVPYYTNREFEIELNDLCISFKVSAKKTDKTVSVSRLRKKDVKRAGKFKSDDVTISFNNPHFEADDLDNFKVKLIDTNCSGGPSVYLNHRKEKIADMLTKEILTEEIQLQNARWRDIRKAVILNASQPKIQKECFRQNLRQEDWDIILQKTEEANKELIDSVIEKMLKFPI